MPSGAQEQLKAWKAAPLTDLIRHLVGTRHQECRDDMSAMETLLALLAMEPGPAHFRLVEIRDLIAQFCRELRVHLAREEGDLFPVLLSLEPGKPAGISKEELGLLRSLLEEEHGQEMAMLSDIQFLTEALAGGPADGSPMARLHASLAGFSERFQEHLKLENQVLFPRMG